LADSQGSSPFALVPGVVSDCLQDRSRLFSYKFIGFGSIHGPKPYKFIGFGAMDVTKPYKFIGRAKPGFALVLVPMPGV
jgi:hypothetical protein